MEIKKFIDIHVPIFSCNLKCDYCYVSQMPQHKVECNFQYSPQVVQKALSQERLDGICHFNVCGMGETLIPETLIEYIRGILENGHTAMIVTNGTLTKRFKAFAKLPDDLKSRLGFKFSFHYLELKRLGMIDVFWDNVRLMRDCGCSISVELTANDSYEPYIEQIKTNCMENIGALCHVTVPRDEATGGINLLSKHTVEEFYNIWKVFDSPMFELKMRHWEEKRTEFCYAGEWSGLLNLGTGELNTCYRQPVTIGNIFSDINKKISFCAVGKCELPHCFNGHSFLAWGDIPEINEENYLEIRDRIDSEGKHWINETMRDQFREKLVSYNREYSNEKKNSVMKMHKKNKRKYIMLKLWNKIQRGVKKIADR